MNWETQIPTITLGILGFLAATWFQLSKHRLEKTTFIRELFFRYNNSYDGLNVGLEKLLLWERSFGDYDSHDTLDEAWDHFFEEKNAVPAHIEAALKYINLCAEEYYWYKKGYVDKDVWNCWQLGMISWYESSYFVKKLVDQDIANQAPYYNGDFLQIFKPRALASIST